MFSLLAALILQSKELPPIVLPPGSSEAFQSNVYAIQAAVDKGDWTEANRLASRLPTREVTLDWNETGLTADQKRTFASARDLGVEVWEKGIEGLKVTMAPKARLKIGFVPELPPNADSPGPAAAVYFDSPAQEDPVIEGVWALVRMADKRPLTAMDVRNETVYAIGAAMGLARQPRPSSVMFRSETSAFAQTQWTLTDSRLTKFILEISDRIRKEVAEKKDPKVGAPQIYLTPDKFEPAPVGQAGEMIFTLQITNQGKGTLDYRLVPDCGCFLIGGYQTVLEPGATAVVPIGINTLDFTGKLHKTLFVYSNDPEFPIKRIPLETVVRPAYRFVNANDDPVVYVDESGGTFETTLVIEDSQSFKVKSVAVTGVRAVVDSTPWSGKLDWPEIDEGSKDRKGIKIKVLIAPSIPAGRTPMQVQVETDSLIYKTLVTTINVQKGIAAVPLSFYFGQLEQAPSRATVVLSRPGKPFKVTKVESDTSFVKASFEPYRDGAEVKIVAEYLGSAPLGRFAGKVKVYTDDPKQPEILIPFEGTVR